MSLFADVILPLALADSYTYEIPQTLKGSIQPGHRVIVPFGRNKLYTAIVLRVHQNKPQNITLKEIHSQLDSKPIVNQHQLKLWQWISFYYMAPLGDVYNAALPAQLKLESKAYVSLSPKYKENKTNLTPTEQEIVEYLKGKSAPQQLSKISRELNNNNIHSHINTLTAKNVVLVNQSISKKYKEKQEAHILIQTALSIEDAKKKLKGARKQQELYNCLQEHLTKHNLTSISRKTLLQDWSFTPSVLTALIDKGVLEQVEIATSRLNKKTFKERVSKELTPHQKEAYSAIKKVFKEKDVCLLHGVTSSGKTEVYIQLIKDTIEKGKQVLFLVPEIALTTQLTNRLQAVFNNDLAIYHSKINDNVRAEIWLKMISDNPYKIIIGVRSSIFIPFQNLGLVIIDEEHDQSYRQTEPSPRYHGKNSAIMYAHFQKAKTLLGSATPAIESYYNALAGKYGLVSMTQRYQNMALPTISIVDTKDLRRRKIMKHLLAPSLIEQIEEALANKQQVILFRNRRGFAPILECKNCGYTPKCQDCDVSLTYHKFQNSLKCHYCNASYPVPAKCPECGEEGLQHLGSGTEQLAEEVSKLFPNALVERMDTDTTRGANSYNQILNDFSEGKFQILVGTKMVSKGLDFDNVRVVGIIQADSLLNYPDFRSHEEGFQMITQASGRSGRKDVAGTVIIQTFNPKHPIFNYVQNNDYQSFFNAQLKERKLFKYPPFYRLIAVKIRYKYENKVTQGANYFAELLKKSLGDRVLGPAIPIVGKVQQYYIRELLLKMELNYPIEKVRATLKQVENKVRQNPNFKYLIIHYEVDI